MTWKEIKKLFDEAGVKDEDKFDYIDVRDWRRACFELTHKRRRIWSIWS